MVQPARVVVDYNTRVILKVIDRSLCKFSSLTPGNVRKTGQALLQRTERIAGMMELLARNGFTFTGDDGMIYADSESVGAQEIRQILYSQGFQDHEFQIFLEYSRKWGMM